MMSPAPGQSITINKPVMIDGRWTTVPHILTRGPDGLASVLSQTITETRPRRTLNLLMVLTAIAQTGAKL